MVIKVGSSVPKSTFCVVERIIVIAKINISVFDNRVSVEKHILAKYGAPTAEALAESALYHVALLEKFDFTVIVISIKASTVREMIAANNLEDKVEVAGTFCLGQCQNGVCVTIGEGVFSVTPDTVEEFFKTEIMAKV